MKRALKLVRNGNSVYVAVPRDVLKFMRWNAGDVMILDVVRCDAIEVHRPGPRDYQAPGVLGVLEGSWPEAVK
jgi:hypothetical protein